MIDVILNAWFPIALGVSTILFGLCIIFFSKQVLKPKKPRYPFPLGFRVVEDETGRILTAEEIEKAKLLMTHDGMLVKCESYSITIKKEGGTECAVTLREPRDLVILPVKRELEE